MKSLFEDEEPKPLSIKEIKKIHMIKETPSIIKLLPEDDEVNTNPYSDNPPQIFIDGKRIPEGIQTSGAFFIRGEEMYSDIRLEFNVKNPKYSKYYKKLKNLVKEAYDDHVLLSSSGVV